MKKIKVLIITGTMNMGGIENQLMHLLRNSDPTKFQIDFTSTLKDPYYRSEIEALGGRCILIPEMKKSNPYPYCRCLYNLMKHEQYDIVHSHELFHSGIVLWVAAMAKVPGRFVHAHNWQDGVGDGKKRPFIREIYNRVMRKMIRRYSTHQLACSTLAAKFLYGDSIITEPSYHLIVNSVDTAKFLDDYDKPEFGEFCDDWINILQVGRVTPVKNQLFLTEIADIFRQRNKHIRILCAGAGDKDYEEKIQQTISEKGLDNYIKMLGPRDDIASLMRKSSAFVLPSHYEGMPLVVIEAQASGLPCVCADTFSHEVELTDGSIRWISLHEPAHVWADSLETAVTQERAKKELVQHQIAEKGFDSKTFAKSLCALYSNVVTEL